MKLNKSRKSGFTLVEIMIVVAIIGLLAAIAIPNFVRARTTSQKNACINNLRQIDGAKQQWALENKAAASATPAATDIQPYLGRGSAGTLPTCPADSTASRSTSSYTMSDLSDGPRLPDRACRHGGARVAITDDLFQSKALEFVPKPFLLAGTMSGGFGGRQNLLFQNNGELINWRRELDDRAGMNPIVEIKDLRVEYRSRAIGQATKLAVDGLNLSVHTGEVFGFLGPNGAGKTTTMNVLLGFVNATSGAASSSASTCAKPIARQRIGYLPELTYYYKFLTAEELLRFYAQIFGIPRAETDRRIDELLKLVELEPARKRPIKTYSKGMQQRVGLAQALINNPDLLILDEPTSGLDPIGRMKVREIIQRLKNEGKTVFFSSHELGEVETVCDRVAILHQGKLQGGRPRERSDAKIPDAIWSRFFSRSSAIQQPART